MKHILIVEDNEKLKLELAQFFRNNGYEVSCIEEFDHVLEDIQNAAPDLVLLDLNLPGVDGLFICRELRMQSELPIVIMTSRNTEIDELISMNYGADDFVTKPFNTQILLARVNNIFKRMDRMSGNKVSVNGLTLDISRSCIISGGMEVELTKNELKILHQLIEQQGAIVSRDTIMSALWDSEVFVDDNTLTVNINRLRKKLEEVGQGELIQTKRGQGYIIP